MTLTAHAPRSTEHRFPARADDRDAAPSLTALAESAEPAYEVLEVEDGTHRVVGVLPPAVREAFLLTHLEGGRDPQGRTIWYPKEVDDGRD